MRIAYINYLFDTKESSVGASVHVRELARAMRELGEHVDVHHLNPRETGGGSLKARIRSAVKTKLRRYLAQVKAISMNLRTGLAEWKIVSGTHPDAILVRFNLFNISSVIVARFRRIPIVLEVNAPMAYESRTFNKEIFHLPFLPEFFEWLNFRLADRLIVVSEELGKYYRDRNISPEKITVIPNGVDEKKFIPLPRSGSIRKQLGIEQQTIIGFIGSFHYWHGVENLLIFIRSTLQQFKDVVFLLVGPGPLKEGLEAHLRSEIDQKRVIFTGHIDHEEVPQYLGVMDIVLAPYPKHAFFYYSPLKLFEYLAAGKAVVTSGFGQINQVVQDGFNGMVFEPDILGNMEKKAFTLIRQESLRRRLGKNARQTVLDKYTWNKAAIRVSDVIRAAIAVNSHRLS